jgi:hypothetical protein
MAILQGPPEKGRGGKVIAQALQLAQDVSLIWGLVVPSLVFLVAFLAAILLYRRFSKEGQRTSDESSSPSP